MKYRRKYPPPGKARGEQNGFAKLRAADIPTIRADDRTQRTIARDFNIWQSTVGAVKRRLTWKHIP